MVREGASSFKDYVLDALSELDGVHARSMFGGYGLYLGEDFFGLCKNDAVYFRVDDVSRRDYERLDSRPFVYSRDGKMRTMAYYEVPVEVIDDRERFVTWAVRAAEVGRKVKKQKKK